jgi:hypothetical protein
VDVDRKANALKLTLDSSEPLQDAIRVVGALYGVTLVVEPGPMEAPEGDHPTESAELSEPEPPVNAAEQPEPAEPGRTSRRSSPAKRRRSRSRGSAATSAETAETAEKATAAEASSPAPSNAELRAWARENGVTVSDRGRVPASVLAAYRSAQAGA